MTGLVGGYNAAPGWDPCSGFGSPDGGAILAGLQGSKEHQVTPDGGASPAGLQEPQKGDELPAKRKVSRKKK
jgi:hypothetical protein